LTISTGRDIAAKSVRQLSRIAAPASISPRFSTTRVLASRPTDDRQLFDLRRVDAVIHLFCRDEGS